MGDYVKAFRSSGAIGAIVVLTLLTCAPSPVRAEEAATDLPRFWSLQLENDLWGSGKDTFYTGGHQLSYAPGTTPPRWMQKLASPFPFFRQNGRSGAFYSLGQTGFTPSDIERTTLIPDDRPYAGWLYVSASIGSPVKKTESSRILNNLEFTLGILGPSAHTDNVQQVLHEAFSGDTPQGWDNQLKDEPGLFITYTRTWERFYPLKDSLELAVAPHLVAALGNVYTYLGSGFMLRLGTRLRDDIGPPAIRPGFLGCTHYCTVSRPNWYLFIGAEGRAVARNIFLDGNTFKDSHSVDKEPLVGDVQLGLAFHLKGVRIALSNIFRSREFTAQDNSTRFGAINFTFYLD